MINLAMQKVDSSLAMLILCDAPGRVLYRYLYGASPKDIGKLLQKIFLFAFLADDPGSLRPPPRLFIVAWGVAVGLSGARVGTVACVIVGEPFGCEDGSGDGGCIGQIIENRIDGPALGEGSLTAVP